MLFQLFEHFFAFVLNRHDETPIIYLVNECTPEGWFEKAGAAVADRATQQENSRRGADGVLPRRAIARRLEDRSKLAHDPNYPSEAVIREVALRLANLFCAE